MILPSREETRPKHQPGEVINMNNEYICYLAETAESLDPITQAADIAELEEKIAAVIASAPFEAPATNEEIAEALREVNELLEADKHTPDDLAYIQEVERQLGYSIPAGSADEALVYELNSEGKSPGYAADLIRPQ
jgi:hypothetical protein